MIARDLTDQRTILIRQEDHADLSSQFAAHWGDGPRSSSAHYESIVTAAAYHDTHFRDIEIDFYQSIASKGGPTGIVTFRSRRIISMRCDRISLG